MGIAFRGSSGGTASVPSMPVHDVGDLLLAFSFRDGSTSAPALPAGWTSIATRTGTTCSARVAYRIATSSSMTSGTWTSATSTAISSYSGVSSDTPSGGVSVTSGSSTTVSYPALTGTDPTGSSWFVCMSGHRSANTSLQDPPTGAVLRLNLADTTDEISVFDTDGSMPSWALRTISVGGTSSGWVGVTVELRAAFPIELGGSESIVSISSVGATAVSTPPATPPKYARFGVFDTDVVEGVTAAPFESLPTAYESHLYVTSDRALFSFGGITRTENTSTVSPHAYAIPVEEIHYSVVSIDETRRRSAYRFLDGFVSTRYLPRPRGGISATYTTEVLNPPKTLYSVSAISGLLESAPVAAPYVTLAYSASEMGSLLEGDHSMYPHGYIMPVLLAGTHRVGGYADVPQWALDMVWALEADGPQLYEWVLDQYYSLVYPIPECVLDSQWTLEGTVREYGEYPLDMVWAVYTESAAERREAALDIFYALSGSQIAHEFTVLLNNLRADYSLPPYAYCTRPVLDVAQRHALHCREAQIQQHDSTAFPVGWQTFEERLPRVGAGLQGVENLASLLVDPEIGQTVTAAIPFDGWYHSPVHLENMLFDFGPDATLEYHLGVEYFLPSIDTDYGTTIPTPPRILCYAVKVLIAFPPENSIVAAEYTLNMQYALNTATRETLYMSWSSYAYKHLSIPHKAIYSAVISAAHAAPSGALVVAAHTTRMQYSLQVTSAAPYGSTISVETDHGTLYDIYEFTRVNAQHTSPWSIRQSFSHTILYAESAVVAAYHASPYSGKPSVVYGHIASYEETAQVAAQNRSPYSDSATVYARFTAPYSLVGYAITSHTTRYENQVPVRRQHVGTFDLLDHDPVSATHRTPYAILSGETVYLASGFLVLVNGLEIDCKELTLEMDEGDAYWTGTVVLTDPEEFSSVNRGDAITLFYYGQTFNLLVDSKTIRRSSSVDASFLVTALSPASRMDAPYMESIDRTQTTPIMARALVEDILGVPVDWQIRDWLIQPYRFAVSGRSPLAAAKMVVEAVRGILRSTPEGGLVASYLFPTTTTEYAGATLDFSVSDVENNLTYDGRVQNMEVFNEFRVRDSEDYQSDTFEWEPLEGSEDRGVLRAYVTPWRPATVETVHTSTGAINLVPLGIESRSETQEVEIIDGVAQLSWPAVNITDVVWLSEPLGTLYLESRTPRVMAPDTETNWGYGLARVTYQVDCLKYEVQAPVGLSVQFILVDRGI